MENIGSTQDVTAESLGDVFNRLYVCYEDVDTLCGSDKCLSDRVQKLLSEFVTLDQNVRNSGTFSANEVIDDVKTCDIKLLLVTYYLGELTLKIFDNRCCH